MGREKTFTHDNLQKHALKKKHHKSYRVRHVAVLVLMVFVVLGSAAQIGILYGKESLSITAPSSRVEGVHREVATVDSPAGFSLQYDQAVLTESRHDDETSVLLQPRVGSSSSAEAASRLALELGAEASVLSGELGSGFSTKLLSSKEDVIAGKTVTKYIYEHTPRFGENIPPVYSVSWQGVANKQPFVLRVEGLVSKELPEIYSLTIASLRFDDSPVVLGSNVDKSLNKQTAAVNQLTDRYLADLVSPAVVKIYHVNCGIVILNGQRFSNEGCQMATGTGFFVSSDGYIATNGHVVVFEAEDALIQILLSEPVTLSNFLKSVGFSQNQISAMDERPELLAAAIAKIYKLPPNVVRFEREEQAYLISLGLTPVTFKNIDAVKRASSFKETNVIKRAAFVAANYSAADIYAIQSGNDEGFSSSDVALLKVDMSDTPFISFSEQDARQNQAISIIGFPNDAENALIDNSTLNVSVTNGTISSIRQASGSSYKLYQSDADASQGNSGGPAVDEEGRVVGVLTYRFKNETSVDAAKSYLRDSGDILELASDNNISFTTTGQTQERWQKGLVLFSQNKFSRAIKEFDAVKTAYPAHRLVGSYIDASKQAIANGQDVGALTTQLYAAAMVIGLIIGAISVVVIVRHRAHHQAFVMADGSNMHNYLPAM